MNQPSPEELGALAKELVAAAEDKNVTVRVLGGVAVYLTCPGIKAHPALQRMIKDIDLVALAGDFDAIARVFAARGAVQRSRDSQQLVFEREGVEIEVSVPDFREDHRIDLAPRLSLASPTVPLADLLLIKLQRSKFAEKDIQDALALLLEHRVAKGDEQDQINPEYLARLCARDWGLFRTVYANTVTLEQVLDKYLEPGEAQPVWQRIELVQGEMDRQPKSLTWMLNQIIRRPTEVPA